MAKIPVAQPTLPEVDKIIPHLKKIIKSRMLSNFSTYAQAFEHYIRNYVKNPYVRVVSSADIGLIIALKALDLPEGGEVILPSFTFASTANAVIWNRLKPVFVDVDKNTFNIDPANIAAALTKNTVAIMPVHIFGNPCDIDKIKSIAGSIPVLYDAAHAFGAVYKGRKIGSFGTMEVFSFSGTKLVTSAEGGAITTTDKNLDERIKYLRGYGFYEDYNCRMIGINGKISELNAMLGVLTSSDIDKFIKKRNHIAKRYIRNLSRLNLKFQLCQKYSTPAYKDFCILTEQRDVLAEYLSGRGVMTKKYFFPVHRMDAYREYEDTLLPETDYLSKHLLCLPIFSHLSNDAIDEVCDKIRIFFKKRRKV